MHSIQASGDTKLQSSNDHDITVESLPDEVTIKRISKALIGLSEENNKWVKFLFTEQDDVWYNKPRFRPLNDKSGTVVTDILEKSSLNESQKSAVKLVATALDIAVIHGRTLFRKYIESW